MKRILVLMLVIAIMMCGCRKSQEQIKDNQNEEVETHDNIETIVSNTLEDYGFDALNVETDEQIIDICSTGRGDIAALTKKHLYLYEGINDSTYELEIDREPKGFSPESNTSCVIIENIDDTYSFCNMFGHDSDTKIISGISIPENHELCAAYRNGSEGVSVFSVGDGILYGNTYGNVNEQVNNLPLHVDYYTREEGITINKKVKAYWNTDPGFYVLFEDGTLVPEWNNMDALLWDTEDGRSYRILGNTQKHWISDVSNIYNMSEDERYYVYAMSNNNSSIIYDVEWNISEEKYEQKTKQLPAGCTIDAIESIAYDGSKMVLVTIDKFVYTSTYDAQFEKDEWLTEMMQGGHLKKVIANDTNMFLFDDGKIYEQ